MSQTKAATGQRIDSEDFISNLGIFIVESNGEEKESDKEREKERVPFLVNMTKY